MTALPGRDPSPWQLFLSSALRAGWQLLVVPKFDPNGGVLGRLADDQLSLWAVPLPGKPRGFLELTYVLHPDSAACAARKLSSLPVPAPECRRLLPPISAWMCSATAHNSRTVGLRPDAMQSMIGRGIVLSVPSFHRRSLIGAY